MLGYAVERGFSVLFKFIDNWAGLLLVLTLGYLINGLFVYQLHKRAVDLDEPPPNLPEWNRKARDSVLTLWRQRNNPPNYTQDQVIELNADLVRAAQSFAFCDDSSRELPTNYPLNMSSYQRVFTCHARVGFEIDG
jgi:hypothetical protein